MRPPKFGRHASARFQFVEPFANLVNRGSGPAPRLRGWKERDRPRATCTDASTKVGFSDAFPAKSSFHLGLPFLVVGIALSQISRSGHSELGGLHPYCWLAPAEFPRHLGHRHAGNKKRDHCLMIGRGPFSVRS